MGLGYEQVLWMKEAASYGAVEVMTTGTLLRSRVSTDIGLGLEIDRLKTDQIDGSGLPKLEEDDVGLNKPGGTFKGALPWEAFGGTLLKHVIGDVATSGAGPYAHVYTWDPLLYDGLSIAVNRAGATYIHHGCQIANLELVFAIGDYVRYTATIISAQEANLATLSAPATENLMATYPYMLPEDLTLSIDTGGGFSAVGMIGATLNFATGLAEGDEQSFALGSLNRVGLPAGAKMVTGTLRRRHKVDASNESLFYTRFKSGATVKLKIATAHATDGGVTGEFLFDQVRLEGSSPKASDGQYIIEEIPFTAYDLHDGTNTKVTINDNDADPVTDTADYDGSGV